jgi:hypothetical protein
LSCEIPNREFRKDNLSSDINDLLELLVDELPFGLYDLIIFFGVVNSDFGIFLLALELQLQVKQAQVWVLEVFWLLLESSIGEGLLECDSIYKEGISD